MADTKRTVLYLDAEASVLLDTLAPSEKRRGRYVSDLLRAAAAQQQAGRTDVLAPPTEPRARLAALIAEAAPLAAQLLTDPAPVAWLTSPTGERRAYVTQAGDRFWWHIVEGGTPGGPYPTHQAAADAGRAALGIDVAGIMDQVRTQADAPADGAAS